METVLEVDLLLTYSTPCIITQMMFAIGETHHSCQKINFQLSQSLHCVHARLTAHQETMICVRVNQSECFKVESRNLKR